MTNLRHDIEAERAKYGNYDPKKGPVTMLTPDECVNLLNAVAYRNPGWALVEKTSGTYGKRFDGKKCSVDGLVWKANRTFVDALGDAGGKSLPAWQVHTIGETSPKGNVYKPHTGPLVEPVARPGEPPPPPPPPPVEEPACCACDCAALEARIKALEAMKPPNMDIPFELLTRIEKLEQSTYAVIPDRNAPAVPSDNAALSWSHGHGVRFRIQRIEPQ